MDIKKLSPYLLPLIPILSFFIIWELFATLEIIEVALFSKPSIIFNELSAMTPELTKHLSATFFRLMISFFVAVLLGLFLGIITGYNKHIYNFFDPLITTMMAIPGIAMAPVFIIWFGFGDTTIIFIGVIVAFFPIFYNVAMGIRSVDKELIRATKMMGGKRKHIFLKVYIPYSISYLILGLKLGLARCWRTIIAVEFIAATNFGLGFMIWDAHEYLRSSVVYGGIILTAILFFAMEKTALKYLENKTIKKWGMLQNES